MAYCESRIPKFDLIVCAGWHCGRHQYFLCGHHQDRVLELLRHGLILRIGDTSQTNAEARQNFPGETDHGILPSAVHHTVERIKDASPNRQQAVHALSLSRTVQEDLTQKCCCSESRFSHARWVASEHLRFEKLVQHREHQALEYKGKIDARVGKDFISDESPLKVSESCLSDFPTSIGALL